MTAALILEFGHVIKHAQSSADHFLDQFQVRQGLSKIGSHQFSISEDRDPVGNFENLIQKVGDENNSHSFTLKFAHHAKKLTSFMGVKAGCRLIQNQDLERCNLE